MIRIIQTVAIIAATAFIPMPACAAYIGDDVLNIAKQPPISDQDKFILNTKESVSMLVGKLGLSKKKQDIYNSITIKKVIRVVKPITLRRSKSALVVAREGAKIISATNSIIITNGPLHISHGRNNIIISGGDVDISHDSSGSNGSIVISKGKITIGHTRGSIIYALNGVKISHAKDVKSFNTSYRVNSGGNIDNVIVNSIIEPLFKDETLPKPKPKKIHEPIEVVQEESKKLSDADIKAALSAIENDENRYEHVFNNFDNSLQNNKIIALAAVEKYGASYKFIDEALKNDKEIALAAIKGKSFAFVYRDFIEPLKSNRNFILSAIKVNSRLIEHLESGLQKDKEILLTSINHSGDRFKLIHKFIRDGMENDKDIVLSSIMQSNDSLYLLGNKLFKGDGAFFLKAVKANGMALEFISSPFQKNKKIVMAAVKQNGLALVYADKHLKKDREVVLAAVKQNGLALAYADVSLQKDKQITLIAVNQNRHSFDYVSESSLPDINAQLGNTITKGKEVGEIFLARYNSGVDNSVLSPDGKRIYVFKNGYLHQYQLAPFKLINSRELDFETNQRYDANKRHLTYITDNEKYIIIYRKNKIEQIDVKTGATIKSVKFKSDESVLNGNEFVTFDNNNVITVWNANNLKKIKQWESEHKWAGKAQLFDEEYNHRFEIYYGLGISFSKVFKVNDKIILFRPANLYSHTSHYGEITIFDAETYKMLISIRHLDQRTSSISLNLKTLYVNRVTLWPVSGHIQQFNYRRREMLKYDLVTGAVSEIKSDKAKEIIKGNIYLHLTSRGLSPTGEFYLAARRFIVYPKKEKRYKLHVFKDGEAVLRNKKTNEFKLTNNARKHLKMKNTKGEILPINNVTFMKYIFSDTKQ